MNLCRGEFNWPQGCMMTALCDCKLLLVYLIISLRHAAVLTAWPRAGMTRSYHTPLCYSDPVHGAVFGQLFVENAQTDYNQSRTPFFLPALRLSCFFPLSMQPQLFSFTDVLEAFLAWALFWWPKLQIFPLLVTRFRCRTSQSTSCRVNTRRFWRLTAAGAAPPRVCMCAHECACVHIQGRSWNHQTGFV